jgi:hypothetical protein
MPTIKTIDSVKVDMYAREHPPPHFHVKYAEYEEFIVIETLETYAGYIPKTQRAKVIDWASQHQNYLLGLFKQLNPRL